MTDLRSPNDVVFATSQHLTDAAMATFCDQVSYLHEAIETVNVENGKITLGMVDIVDDSARDRLRAEIDELAVRVARSYAKVRTNVISEHEGEATYREDPMPHLRATRQAIATYPGTFILRGDILKVINGLDAYFKSFALRLGAEEQDYPTTVPLRSMIDNGYLSSFPHHALTVSRIHADLADLARAAQALDGDSLPHDIYFSAGQMLAPTVCYHCFESMRGQDVRNVGRVFTAKARCHRHEGAATSGLTRLQTFNMREIILFDTLNKVAEQKQAILDEVEADFTRWGVAFEIATATDPFFPIQNETKRAFQSLQALKHELRLKLPYDDDDLACASFNNHKDTLVKSYAITDSDTDMPSSGCVGFGLERLAFSLFSQFGMDLGAWPAALRKDILISPGGLT